MIASPDVYKSPNSDCYIVFGEAKASVHFHLTSVYSLKLQIEDMNSQSHLSAAQHLTPGGGFGTAASKAAAPADEIPTLEPAEEEGEVDETGVDPKDIELVMAQVNCSRAKAVRVLKESGGDLINASKFDSTCSLAINSQCID